MTHSSFTFPQTTFEVAVRSLCWYRHTKSKIKQNTGESLGIGQGIYSGAVNQKLFGGTLNSAGQPGCGSSCGVCYELMTTGVNAYNGGTAGGSTIQMMVVDACYSNAGAPNWCSSNTDSGEDDFGCSVHFDIDTDPTEGGVPAIGQDGSTWTRK